MIEIISKPDPHLEITCNFCGAKLRYTRDDIETKTFFQFDDASTIERIMCPNCEFYVTVRT